MTLKASDLHPGQIHEQKIVEDLKRAQIVQYAGVSGDYNPLHTDEPFATQVAGFPGVFAHGMLTMGMTARALTDFVGDGRLRSYGVRFLSQVWPGDDLAATLTVKEIRLQDGDTLVDLDVVTKNGEGVEVLRGYATATVEG